MTSTVLQDALRGALAWQQHGWPAAVHTLESAPPPLDPDLPADDDTLTAGMLRAAAEQRDVDYQARRDAATSGFTLFADGTQTTTVLGTALTTDHQPAPVTYYLGGAAVMTRDPRTRTPRTVALTRFDGVLIPTGSPVPAAIPSSVVEHFDASDGDAARTTLDLVRAKRVATEQHLIATMLADSERAGWFLVDGDLAGHPPAPRLAGVVKSLNLRLAAPEVSRAVMQLRAGQRTGLFPVRYTRGAGELERLSWFLRLRPAGPGDPAVGVIRVELSGPACDSLDPAHPGNATLADEVSRWLLAERGRPGADVHNPILMIEVIEQRLRAALPERAWLTHLFTRR